MKVSSPASDKGTHKAFMTSHKVVALGRNAEEVEAGKSLRWHSVGECGEVSAQAAILFIFPGGTANGSVPFWGIDIPRLS